MSKLPRQSLPSQVKSEDSFLGQDDKKTLVVFAYNEASKLYARNLEYFLNVGVFENNNVEYWIAVNGDVLSFYLA